MSKNRGAHHLVSILDAAKRASSNSNTLHIFDLDSTLFDVEPRLIEIMKAFAAHELHRDQYPNACEILERLQELPKVYHFGNILEGLGLNKESDAFFNDIYEFWRRRFFADDYLHHDEPYPGAVEFVQELYRCGAHILYLTGRPEGSMLKGTQDSLAQWNFPMDSERAKLSLKPHRWIPDADFKRDYLLDLSKSYTNLILFENEPANILAAQKVLPHIEVVFIDTAHSGTHEVDEGVMWIDDFRLR